jgi:hypothetical protein
VRNLDGGTAVLSVTTDGTIGALATANITAFDIKLTDALGMTELTNTNAQESILGANFTATVSALSYDFDAVGINFVIFEGDAGSVLGDPGGYYCIQTFDCVQGGPGEGFNSMSLNLADALSARSGEVVIATASAVPEPATWAMMLIGFGGLGAAVRNARIGRRPVTA